MRAEWFDWARYSVIEYLFPKGWYNHDDLPEGKKFTFPKGMIADSATSKLLAMARFRQLRVKLGITLQTHHVYSTLKRRGNDKYEEYTWRVCNFLIILFLLVKVLGF